MLAGSVYQLNTENDQTKEITINIDFMVVKFGEFDRGLNFWIL